MELEDMPTQQAEHEEAYQDNEVQQQEESQPLVFWEKILGQQPQKVSQLLANFPKLPPQVVEAYDAYYRSLVLKKRRSAKEIEFSEDYVMHIGRLHDAKARPIQNQQVVDRPSIVDGGSNTSTSWMSVTPPMDGEIRYNTPAEEANQFLAAPPANQEVLGKAPANPIVSHQVKMVKTNDLIIKPENFDGVKPPPRKWLDNYEKACAANRWLDEIKVLYFPSFLSGTAYDWYLSMGQKRIARAVEVDQRSPWILTREIFIRYFLGDSDKMAIKNEVDTTFQQENEGITTFMPRLLRLVQLVEPNKPEDELVELVKSKLRSNYQDKLAMHSIFSLDTLNDLCLKIEAGLQAAQQAAVRERANVDSKGKKKFETRSNKGGKKMAGSTSDERKAAVTCYRCERKGHYSPDCRAKTKPDGSPCNNTKTKSKNSINVVQDQQSNEEDEIKPTISGETVVQQAYTVRSAGQHHICSLETENLPQAENKLIVQGILVNGMQINGIIDTGASMSVIHEDIVKTNKWIVKPTQEALTSASKSEVMVVGEILARIELHLEGKMRATTHRLLVVRDLCAPMLFGIELQRALELNIDVSSKKPLTFKRGAVQSGIRTTQQVTIPPRSLKVIEAEVSTSARTIATLPFGFDRSIMVANAVSEVKNGKVCLLVANIDTVGIAFNKWHRIASFEPITNTKDEKIMQSINCVIQLSNTNETVRVGEQLSSAQRQELNKLLADYTDVFSINNSLGKTDLMEHQIELIPGAKPFVEPMRRHPKAHNEETNRQVKTMLKQGVIEESQSPWASEYVIVKKKTGDYRLCIDFRRLNALTKKNCYPLPNIEQCIESLAGKRFFTQLDFASGYWQMPMASSSKELTAFRTTEGLYQFKRMPFGLTNAPASFQKLINALFTGLKGLNLQVFLDDICLASDTWAEHLTLIKKVLEVIRKSKLKLKGSKCVFGAASVTFLGHRLSKEGVHQDPKKLKALLELEAPRDQKGVRSILGAFGYYRRFVENYAIISEPLTNLTQKQTKFVWTEKEQAAFETIKRELARNATLRFCNDQDPLLVKTDASITGVAGMLLQQQDGEWRLICCCSRKLSSAETRYGITELEALAIIYTVNKFRYFLLGRKFQIMTDHCALCALNTKKLKNRRIERWMLLLSEFDYKIVYTKGSLHRDVDCLSRAPVDDPDDKYADAILAVTSPINAEEWTSHYQDDEARSILLKIREGDREFESREGIIYRGNLLYIPVSKRKQLIQEHHDDAISLHDGVDGTLARLEQVWWPSKTTDVKEFVKTCESCQRRKCERARPTGEMFQHAAYEPLARSPC